MLKLTLHEILKPAREAPHYKSGTDILSHYGLAWPICRTVLQGHRVWTCQVQALEVRCQRLNTRFGRSPHLPHGSHPGNFVGEVSGRFVPVDNETGVIFDGAHHQLTVVERLSSRVPSREYQHYLCWNQMRWGHTFPAQDVNLVALVHVRTIVLILAEPFPQRCLPKNLPIRGELPGVPQDNGSRLPPLPASRKP